MNLAKAIVPAVAVCAALAFAVPSQAQFVYFTDRPTFSLANPGLTTEDFEEANPYTVVSGPQDKTSNNDAFVPGDIIPNLRITAVGGDPSEFYVNIGTYGPTTVMTTNWSDDFARLDFYEGGTGAFGVDLSSTSTGGDYTIRIFGTGGLLDTRTVTSGFFGFSSVENVVRVELDTPFFETFDNVTIGAAGAPSAVPEPGAYGLMAGMFVPGAVFLIRRRK